ncbi:MAG: 50S ribosomal protein L25 [bacterium]|nr:50S ribosomal protein L25 [bacterium]
MTFSIEVKTKTEKADSIREQGLVPGVLYGPETTPVSFSVDSLVFEKLYDKAGESNLIDLKLDAKEPVKVLVQDIQKDPVKGNITHIDLLQINMSKEMYATIPVNFIGESAAVKTLGGTLMKSLREIEVKCLPKDLVGSIDLDLSVLATFDDVVHIKDLVLSAGLTVTENPETVVAKVAVPLTEDQLKAMEESDTGDISKVVVEGEKKEDGETVEGSEESPKEPEKKDK